MNGGDSYKLLDRDVYSSFELLFYYLFHYLIIYISNSLIIIKPILLNTSKKVEPLLRVQIVNSLTLKYFRLL